MKTVRYGELACHLAGGTDREGGGDGPVVVLLHGFGAPGDDLASLWRVVRAPRGTRWLFPAAPIDLGPAYGGGRAWWRIDLEARLRRQARGEAPDVTEVPEGLAAARAAVADCLAAARAELAPSPDAWVLGGFSQGAMLALDVALHEPLALRALVLWSSTLIEDEAVQRSAPARRGLPVLQSHGRDDDLLRFAEAELLRGRLIAAGLEVDFRPFRGGHAIPEAVLEATGDLLERVLG